jgi:Na+/melibiose symporter-like transporter
VTFLLLSQSIGSFFVPIIGIKIGFKYTYILGLSMHFIASAIFIFTDSNFQNLIFIFAGLGLGIFNTSQSNLAVELGDVGDAGNTNAMLTAFRVPIFILVPLLVGFFNSSSSIFLILSFSMSSAIIGILIVAFKLTDPVLPKVRFWLKDS